MFCYTHNHYYHQHHHCPYCCPAAMPVQPTHWCSTCQRFTYSSHHHPVYVRVRPTCGAQQRDRNAIAALAG